MAQDYNRLFNFPVLQRYRWRAQDFLDLQDNGLVAMIRGSWEGLCKGAVLSGFDFVSATGLNFTVSPGIAVGPTGDLMVINVPSTGSFLSPSGATMYRQLAVVRPLISTPASGIITPPTMPLTTAPLFFDHRATVISLTAASGSNQYAATGPNDVVLFGVRMLSGATGFQSSDLDFEIRDILGKNSRFQHDAAHYDQRLLPYRTTNQVVGIKPSQTLNSNSGSSLFSNPKLFSYVNKGVPSIFPKTVGGAFNPADTFLNFQTGAITGGDQTTPAFTPTIPTTGNSIVATVGLSGSDTLVFIFGTIGTYAQCQSAIINQVYAGPGGLGILSNALPICFIILTSEDGVNIFDLDVIDARSLFSYGGISVTQAWPNLFVQTEADLTTAIASATTAGGGVICIESALTLTSAHTIPPSTVLVGREGGSLVTIGSGGSLTLADGAFMRDIWVQTSLTSGAILSLPNNRTRVRDCQFQIPTNSTGECILVTGNANKMYNNVFIGVQGSDTGYGIVYSSGVDNADTDSVFLP